MQVNDLDEFLDMYVDGYLLTDLMRIKEKVPSDMHPGNAAYLMTGAICSGIELLGTLTTEQTTIPACDTCARPEQIRNRFPFEHYCKNYLAKVDSRYAALGPVVRELIRNGIAHSFATKGKIGITRIGHKEDTHLVRMTEEGFIVINADYFFEDFRRAYLEYTRPDISEGGSRRQVALKNYEHMRGVYSAEIERTMQAIEGKLGEWPWAHRGVEYMSHMVDDIEKTGGLQLVS